MALRPRNIQPWQAPVFTMPGWDRYKKTKKLLERVMRNDNPKGLHGSKQKPPKKKSR